MSFSLTRKTDYALVALSALALKRDGDGEPSSARQLAENNGLPLQLLMNVMKELHRASLVGSRRGANGGYYLTRPAEEITLREVIEVLEGPVNVSLCSSESEEDACQMISFCPISHPIRKFNDKLNDFLGELSLRELIEAEDRAREPAGVVV